MAGKYRLTRLLGRGGMGSVWEGVHVSLGTRVAVKFIEAEYADSQEARQRFENEARAAARLTSKHVVKVHDHGLMNDGRPFIVMEFLSGEPLESRLSRVGRLSLQETATVVQQVARALHRAHEVGIVHRDLKPENVFLVRDEEDGTEIVKVVDFGIAKFTDGSTGLSSSTRTGSVLGTPYYMSPEQARGLRSVDARSDLWSLAVIVYRCVVGKLPFVGEAVGDLLVQICVAPTPVPSREFPGLPPAFDAWVARALAKDPAERFQSAADLADALAQLAGVARPRLPSVEQALPSAPTVAAPGPMPTPVHVEGVTAAPFTSPNSAPRRARSPLVWLGAAGGTVIVLGAAVGGVAFARRGKVQPAQDDLVTAVSAPVDVTTTTAPSVAPVAPPSVAPAVAPPPPSASAEPEARPVVDKPDRPMKGSPGPATRGGAATKTGGGQTGGGKTGATDVGY